jgi:hypothetical protein
MALQARHGTPRETPGEDDSAPQNDSRPSEVEALSLAIEARRLDLTARAETRESRREARRAEAAAARRAARSRRARAHRAMVAGLAGLLVFAAVAGSIWLGRAAAVSLPTFSGAVKAPGPTFSGAVKAPGPTFSDAVEAPGERPATRTASPAGLTTGERRQVEALLKAAGFDAGPVDGRIDPRTRQAIRTYDRFQGKEGRRQGEVTRDLLESLRDVTAMMGVAPKAQP